MAHADAKYEEVICAVGKIAVVFFSDVVPAAQAKIDAVYTQ